MDLETGAGAAEMHGAGQVDVPTLHPRLEAAREDSGAARTPSKNDDVDVRRTASPTDAARPTIEVVADRGYHKAERLLELRRAEYRTCIPAGGTLLRRAAGRQGRFHQVDVDGSLECGGAP
jgi:hypothetical protein